MSAIVPNPNPSQRDNPMAICLRQSPSEASSATVSDSSLLSYLLRSSLCISAVERPRVIHMKRCEHCGVWSSEAICKCLKLLPASSLDDPRDEDALQIWQDDGGEG